MRHFILGLFFFITSSGCQSLCQQEIDLVCRGGIAFERIENGYLPIPGEVKGEWQKCEQD